MGELDKSLYQPTIDAILSVADVEKVSVKKIRRALQELFSVEFGDDAKKEINDLIMDRYHNLVDEREKKAAQRIKKMEQDDAKLAAKLQSQDSSTRKVRLAVQSTSKVSKPRKKSSEPRTTSISSLELNLSPKLMVLLDTDEKLPRTQVVKKVWDYIKENDLQNPDDKERSSAMIKWLRSLVAKSICFR